ECQKISHCTFRLRSKAEESAIARARLLTWSLRSTALPCALTVASDTPISYAICLFGRPVIRSSNTRCWASVKDAARSGKASQELESATAAFRNACGPGSVLAAIAVMNLLAWSKNRLTCSLKQPSQRFQSPRCRQVISRGQAASPRHSARRSAISAHSRRDAIAWRCRSTTSERAVLALPSTFFAEFSRTALRRAYFGASAITLDRPFGGAIDMLGRLADSATGSSRQPRIRLRQRAARRARPFSSAPHVGGHPTHHFIFGDNAAGRSFNFVYFSSSVSMEVSRLREGGFFARNTRRNPVVIEAVSIEDFPFRHRAIPPVTCGPGSCPPQYRIECH